MSTELHDAVSEVLHANGVERVFGVLGDANMLYVADFIESGGRYIGGVDERGAVQMADAYARISARVGVATVTHGPGLTNALTSVVEAVRARTPLVVLTGDTPEVRDYIQHIEIASIVGPTGARYRKVRRAEHVVDEVMLAFAQASALNRPVVLDIPYALLRKEVVVRVGARPQRAVVQPDADAIDAALGVVASAKRPLVLGGRGAALSGARDDLVAFARAIGAPLGTSLLGRDMFRGEPFDLGVIGTVAHDVAAETVAAADCIVAFGAGLNDHTTASRSVTDGRAIVHVDIDLARIGRHAPVDAAVIGDARLVARVMTDKLRDAGITPSTFCSPALRARLAGRDPGSDFVDASTDNTLDPRTAMIALNRAFPADRLVVTDIGRFVLAPWRYLHVSHPLDFIHTGNFGSIGLGIAAAVGVAAADPSRPTLGIVGDGGAMMGLVEFTTAVRHRLPLVIAVVDDGCYGAEWDRLGEFGADPKHSLIEWPEFAEVARALGGHGLVARRVEDLDAVGEHVRSGRLPLLVDIKTDPAVQIGSVR